MSTVTVERESRVGLLTLNRPAALNSLDQQMLDLLTSGLDELERDDAIDVIVIRSASDRAFCAGGDMKRIRQLSLSGDHAAVERFFTVEYALNLRIAECPKPYVALLDGVAMGGGLGLSVHGSHRVVSETVVLAMPETRIGFFADVGASWFLPRLPRRAGWWLALTAQPVKGLEAVWCGLGTHCIPGDQQPVMLAALVAAFEQQSNRPADLLDRYTTSTQVLESVLDDFAVGPDTDGRAAFLSVLDERALWFSDADLSAIRQRLQIAAAAADDGAEDARDCLDRLDAGSPASVDATLQLFEQMAGKSLSDCLRTEHALSIRMAQHPDFIEGVRAVLVDKDKQARWQ